ncbi:MAG: DUF4331 family protein [Gemmatimonadota bacterium]|jgi:hypothetical protein
MRILMMMILLSAPLTMALGCSDDDVTGPIPGGVVFNQIERLGNPLVSEALIAKREHGHHNTLVPSQDRAAFTDDLVLFITQVAGRSQTLANTISSVLLPDMLVVQTQKPGSTAGWLTWAVADGYGGRTLSDDVVDVALMAVFGPLLDPANTTACLSTDNVDANNKAFSTTFPYLAAPN